MLDRLLGHWPNAFTGANPEGQPGALESCNNGTVFLDDLDSAPDPLSIQGALLRFLESPHPRTIRRLGTPPKGQTADRPANAWLLVATNRNPREMILSEPPMMREDFLRRFQNIITVPSLQHRPSDIPSIAIALLAKIRGARPLDMSALRWVRDRRDLNHPDRPCAWAGNARELQALLVCAHDLLFDDPSLTWVRAFEQVTARGDDYLDWYGVSDIYGQDSTITSDMTHTSAQVLEQMSTPCANGSCRNEHHVHSHRVFRETVERLLDGRQKTFDKVRGHLPPASPELDLRQLCVMLGDLRTQRFKSVPDGVYDVMMIVKDHVWLTEYYAYSILTMLSSHRQQLELVHAALECEVPPARVDWPTDDRLREMVNPDLPRENFRNRTVFDSYRAATSNLHCVVSTIAARIVALWCYQTGKKMGSELLAELWPIAVHDDRK